MKSLRLRAVFGPLAFALVPIVASAIFVGEITKAAQRVAEGEVERLAVPLEKAAGAYRDAVVAHKEAFHQTAVASAASPALRDLCRRSAPAPEVAVALSALLTQTPSLTQAALVGAAAGRVARPPAVPGPGVAPVAAAEPVRTLELRRPLAEAPACELVLTFATPARLLVDLEALGEVLKERRERAAIRQDLPRGYRFAFLGIVGAIMAITAAVAIAIASRTSRRIDRLVAATRRIGEGDLESPSALGGADELADLSLAFDQMIADLRRSRAEIAYLQKIGAWQEVARRLAHEIKNPLTPIQLAVQQIHTKYDGDDPRYRKLLDDAHAIVTEEIAALRRLVDAFHRFAKLPRVEPRPLDLATLVDDVARELPGAPPDGPGLALEFVPPSAPVTVAGDRQLLRGALANLVENARQAGARRVRLAWRASADGSRAFLEVSDDGPGIPAELRDRIFDPYVTTKEHGTGLGLAIVKKTLLDHGGDVTIGPSPVGARGACFVLELPTSPSPARAAGSDPSSRASAS